MRAFLFFPIALVAAGMLLLRIRRPEDVPDRPLVTVFAGNLEQRSPFHVISSSLVARTDVVDQDVIPDEVNQSPKNPCNRQGLTTNVM